MKLEQIISLANVKVRLQFLAMERSLRSTGCDLPLLVIPFDETRFPLPGNAQWIEDEALFEIIRNTGAVSVSRKYLALTLPNCAYFDADIIHLRDPRAWLAPLPEDVFVVADTEWNKARWTFTPETRELYGSKTTLWLLDNFNSGFFAHGTPAAKIEQIKSLLTEPQYWNLTQGKGPTKGEQEGANLLIHQNGREVHNLCLPPYRMESTMACDYPEDVELILRRPNAPAFIHYAGHGRNIDAPIARLIFDHLSSAEAAEMKSDYHRSQEKNAWLRKWPLGVRILNQFVQCYDRRFYIQPRL
jgi:hypothetical protein